VQRQDYIERMIAQLAAAIGQILGLAKSGEAEHAERDLASTWSSTLGLRRPDVDRLDEATLRSLLGDRRPAAAMLLEAEAEVKRLQGQPQAAARLESLAARLRD
jgi:hypothetical protein